MHEIRYDDCNMLRDGVVEFLSGKRNLMVYDGIRDGLNENVEYRFFYSSPCDALEFVIGDIFNYPVDINFGEINIECFGKISMIREPGYCCEEVVECPFGVVLIEKIKVREIDKINVILNLSFYGIRRLKEAIDYYEKLFCVKINE